MDSQTPEELLASWKESRVHAEKLLETADEKITQIEWQIYEEKREDAPDATLHASLEHYIAKKAQKDNLEKRLDEVDAELEPLKQQVIDSMTKLEYNKVGHNGVTYSIVVVSRPAIVPEKRGEFIKKLKEKTEDGIVQTDYINANTLWGWFNRVSDEDREFYGDCLLVNETIQLKSPRDYKRKRDKR